MAIFRRRPKPEALTVADDSYPFFTARQGERFRGLAQAAFADVGLEVTVHERSVVDAAGREFGLDNVATVCHLSDAGERAWPDLVQEHVQHIVVALDQPSPFETLTAAQVLKATYPRIVPADGMPPSITYGRPVAAGLIEILNLDQPTTVAYFNDEAVERFGHDELFRAARVNLRDVEPDEVEQVGHPDGWSVHLVYGESMFVASLLLRLPEIVARYDGPPDPEMGVLVAIPSRDQLYFHAVRDAGAAPALDLLADAAATGYQDGGDLSPSVYWWRATGIAQVTELTEDGLRTVSVPDLAHLLHRLGA